MRARSSERKLDSIWQFVNRELKLYELLGFTQPSFSSLSPTDRDKHSDVISGADFKYLCLMLRFAPAVRQSPLNW
jgi:hypothetical protein